MERPSLILLAAAALAFSAPAFAQRAHPTPPVRFRHLSGPTNKVDGWPGRTH